MLYEGELVWKSFLEYNPHGLLRGTPYFIITRKGWKREDHTYCLYEYDTDSDSYVPLIEAEDDGFGELHELGMEKEREKRKELYPSPPSLFPPEWPGEEE
jgi:hypothetical protein